MSGMNVSHERRRRAGSAQVAIFFAKEQTEDPCRSNTEWEGP